MPRINGDGPRYRKVNPKSFAVFLGESGLSRLNLSSCCNSATNTGAGVAPAIDKKPQRQRDAAPTNGAGIKQAPRTARGLLGNSQCADYAPLDPPPELLPPDTGGEGISGGAGGAGGAAAAGGAGGGAAGRGGIGGRGAGAAAAGLGAGGFGGATGFAAIGGFGGMAGLGMGLAIAGLGAGLTAAGARTAGFGAGFGAATAAGFLAGFAIAAGFLAGLRAAALALALLFAAGLRAAEARRAAVADFRALAFRAAGLRAEALVAFGLRDAAARLAFPGFLDFVAFAMIDLPIFWANLFNYRIPGTFLLLFLIRLRPLSIPSRDSNIPTYFSTSRRRSQALLSVLFEHSPRLLALDRRTPSPQARPGAAPGSPSRPRSG
jgi:hypothetical protein